MTAHVHDEKCLLDCWACRQPLNGEPTLTLSDGHQIHARHELGTPVSMEVSPLPQPGEVIAKPESDLAIGAVAPDEAVVVAEQMKPDVVVPLPNVFDRASRKTLEEAAAVDMVNNPPHYNSHPSGVECIEITRWMTFTGGNAFKYVFRAEHKNGRQDYEKAIWYLRDTLDNKVPLWLPGPTLPARKPLLLVLDHESNPKRYEFFNSVGYGSVSGALGAVEALLDND